METTFEEDLKFALAIAMIKERNREAFEEEGEAMPQSNTNQAVSVIQYLDQDKVKKLERIHKGSDNYKRREKLLTIHLNRPTVEEIDISG